ncbi:vascular endothelial growth factor receptor 1-like isoform X2 [Oculina patagonica]
MSFVNLLRIPTNCCIFLALLLLPHAEGVLKLILEPPDPSYARIGSSAKLVWNYSVDNKQAELVATLFRVQDSGGSFVAMVDQLSDGTVVNHANIPAAYKGRVRIEGKATLVIENITHHDNTRFECRLVTLSDEIVSVVQLIVTEAPQLNISPVHASYNEGSLVNISCNASGIPDPDVQWIRNGKVKTSGKKTAFLTFNNISRADDGQYTCRANNSAGTDEHHVTLVVHYVPTIQEATASAPKSWIGQTVTLKCVSDGVPTPTLTWYKPDGSQMHNVTASQNTVNVKMDVDQDFGDYKCDADNGLVPADYKIVKVQQIRVPATATIDDLPSEVTDNAITLKWNEPQDNGKVITQYTVYQRVVTDGKPGEWIKLKTTTDVSVRELKVELKQGNVYEFVVTATNELGESLKDDGKIKRVKASGVPPTITKKSKNKVTVIEGNVLYLACEAEGYPAPLFTWRKNGKMLQSSVNKTDLIIDDTSEEDTGSYECKAVNPAGAVSYTVEVTIKGSSCNETILHIVYAIVIVLLLIVILILTIVLRRMRSRTGIPKTNRTNICAGCGGELVVLNTIATETDKQSSSKAPSGDSGKTYALPSSGNYMPLHPSARRWEINREQVKIIKIIGKGAFGEVAKATAWNISGNEEYTTVAVKMLKANAPDSDRKDLLAEVELMKKLKPHPHVIKLLACVTETDPLLVVIEYVPFGDLLGYLRKSRGLNDTYFKDPDVKPQTSLTAEQLMRFAWQIADGMFYLSSKKIIHRDLAARNVLVGEEEKCKVTDFGMARNVHQDDIYTRQSRGRLPVKWTAYEALLYGTYTTQSDVWSYGVLLYEILTVGGSPYPGINARQIARKLQEGFRMPKPKHVDNKLYQIMLKCWEENPSNRPTFAELKDTMKEMEKNHKTYVNLKHYDNSLYANVEDLTVD